MVPERAINSASNRLSRRVPLSGTTGTSFDVSQTRAAAKYRNFGVFQEAHSARSVRTRSRGGREDWGLSAQVARRA
jgi:hypothetical protein